MKILDLVIEEENKHSFLVLGGNIEGKSRNLVRFKVHDYVRDNYVVSKYTFGSEDPVKIIDILSYEEEAIDLAYLKSKEYIKDNFGNNFKYQDKTSFKDKI